MFQIKTKKCFQSNSFNYLTEILVELILKTTDYLTAHLDKFYIKPFKLKNI